MLMLARSKIMLGLDTTKVKMYSALAGRHWLFIDAATLLIHIQINRRQRPGSCADLGSGLSYE
jgi:hypothetical protein